MEGESMDQVSFDRPGRPRRTSSARRSQNKSQVDALSVVVLGASGDLAKKKTFPALFALFCQGWALFRSWCKKILPAIGSSVQLCDLPMPWGFYIHPCNLRALVDPPLVAPKNYGLNQV